MQIKGIISNGKKIEESTLYQFIYILSQTLYA